MVPKPGTDLVEIFTLDVATLAVAPDANGAVATNAVVAATARSAVRSVLIRMVGNPS
jgi:hypothetical protein